MGIVQLDYDLIYINNESERTLLLNIRTQWQYRKDEIKRQVYAELPKLKLDVVILKEELL